MPSSPTARSAALAGSGTGEGLPTMNDSGKVIDSPAANERSSLPSTSTSPIAGRLVLKSFLSKVPETLNGSSFAKGGGDVISRSPITGCPLTIPDISAESGVVDVRSSPRSKVPTSPEQAVIEAQVTVPVIEASEPEKVTANTDVKGEESVVKVKSVIDDAYDGTAAKTADARSSA